MPTEIDAKTVEQKTKCRIMIDRVVDAEDREVSLQNGNGECLGEFRICVGKIIPKIWAFSSVTERPTEND